jgi:arabinogalactan oligomer/maltooligosaccharide transport system permease protein
MSTTVNAMEVGRKPDEGHTGSLRVRRLVTDTVAHVFLAIMAVIWLIPIVWIFAESFNAYTGQSPQTFFPTEWTLDNYRRLFTETSQMNFPAMFLRTFIIAVFVCIIQLFFVLAVAFCMSRLRFTMRKPFMNGALVLGMFPAIMSIAALYNILKVMGLVGTQTGDPDWSVMLALIIAYAAGAGSGFYVMKGFMDTIPLSLDEAATLDGCTKWDIFVKIILPITKPMIVYQTIVAFLVPWLDFVLAKVIARTADHYTVSLGLFQMLERELINTWYARFAAGAVCVAVPIAILFIIMQRFYETSMSGSVKG